MVQALHIPHIFNLNQPRILPPYPLIYLTHPPFKYLTGIAPFLLPVDSASITSSLHFCHLSQKCSPWLQSPTHTIQKFKHPIRVKYYFSEKDWLQSITCCDNTKIAQGRYWRKSVKMGRKNVAWKLYLYQIPYSTWSIKL